MIRRRQQAAASSAHFNVLTGLECPSPVVQISNPVIRFFPPPDSAHVETALQGHLLDSALERPMIVLACPVPILTRDGGPLSPLCVCMSPFVASISIRTNVSHLSSIPQPCIGLNGREWLYSKVSPGLLGWGANFFSAKFEAKTIFIPFMGKPIKIIFVYLFWENRCAVAGETSFSFQDAKLLLSRCQQG